MCQGQKVFILNESSLIKKTGEAKINCLVVAHTKLFSRFYQKIDFLLAFVVNFLTQRSGRKLLILDRCKNSHFSAAIKIVKLNF